MLLFQLVEGARMELYLEEEDRAERYRWVLQSLQSNENEVQTKQCQ